MKQPRRTRPGDRRHGSDEDPCVYCGQPSSDWEHVIPTSYGIPTLAYGARRRQKTMPPDTRKIDAALIASYCAQYVEDSR